MSYVKFIVLAILVVVALTLLAGCTSPASPTATPSPVPDQNLTVKPGDTVTVDYIGNYTNDTVFDTSIESLGKSCRSQQDRDMLPSSSPLAAAS